MYVTFGTITVEEITVFPFLIKQHEESKAS